MTGGMKKILIMTVFILIALAIGYCLPEYSQELRVFLRQLARAF